MIWLILLPIVGPAVFGLATFGLYVFGILVAAVWDNL